MNQSRTRSRYLAAILVPLLAAGCGRERPENVRPDVATDFCPASKMPRVDATAFVDARATVIGAVEIGAHVFIGPAAFVRGDEGQSIKIGDDSNVQDCAGVHGLETIARENGVWREVTGRAFTSDGRRAPDDAPQGDRYSVWIGRRVSIAHQALVHGPAWVGDDTFVGMQAQVFNARVGKGSFIGPRALVMGVDVADGRMVAPGAVVTDQKAADALPAVAGTSFEKLNAGVVHVNTTLADEYRKAGE